MLKDNMYFQDEMERRQESSSHHDCIVTTPPPRFNPVPCYDCCTAYTRELTAEAVDETFEVHVRKKTARERRWRSFKRPMNENRTVAQMKNRARMTNVPSGTRPDPGCPPTRAMFPHPSRPPHAMGIRECHGMGAWSRWSRVARW
jgi:hypothetical protein